MKNKHLFEQFMKENGLEFNVPFTAEYEKIRTPTTVLKQRKLHELPARDSYIL